MTKQSARAAELLHFTLPGRVLDELVDWKNWRGRAAVFVDGRTRPAGRGTRTAVAMRRDDLTDLVRYLEWLDDAVAGLTPAERSGTDMLPVRRVLWRLQTLLGAPR